MYNTEVVGNRQGHGAVEDFWGDLGSVVGHIIKKKILDITIYQHI